MTTLFPQIKRVDEDETSKIIKNVLFDDQDEVKLEQILDEFMHLTEESITYSDEDDDDADSELIKKENGTKQSADGADSTAESQDSDDDEDDGDDEDGDEDDDDSGEDEDDDDDDDDDEDDDDDDSDSDESDSDVDSDSSDSDDDRKRKKHAPQPASIAASREPTSWNLDQFIKTIPVTTKPQNARIKTEPQTAISPEPISSVSNPPSNQTSNPPSNPPSNLPSNPLSNPPSNQSSNPPSNPPSNAPSNPTPNPPSNPPSNQSLPSQLSSKEQISNSRLNQSSSTSSSNHNQHQNHTHHHHHQNNNAVNNNNSHHHHHHPNHNSHHHNHSHNNSQPNLQQQNSGSNHSHHHSSNNPNNNNHQTQPSGSFMVSIDLSKLKRIPVQQNTKAPTPTSSSSKSILTAKALKHEADAEKDKTKQAIKYLESAMYFVLHGDEIENIPASILYNDTIPLFKHVIRLSMPGGDTQDNMTNLKVHTLGLRCISLVHMKLYKLREREIIENHKIISSQTNSPIQQAEGSLIGVKPQLLNAYKRQVAILNQLKYANDYWQRADQFCDQHPAVRVFFSTIESNCGALTLATDFSKLLDQVKCGLKLLRTS